MIGELEKRRITLAHDWLVGKRGGELVLDRLAGLFGPTDLYTLVDNGVPISEAISACRVVTSPLQRFPGARGRLRRHYLPMFPWAVERLRVKPCDLLISTSSAVMKSIIPPDGTPHLCYCHAPARYLWTQSDAYGSRRGSAGARLRLIGLRAMSKSFRRWDRRTATRVTRFLANSRYIADEIRRCFNRDADVVHPPVATDYFTPDAGIQREDWLLVVSALEPYKRTDVAIAAANRIGITLKVAGQGTQRAALQSIAGPTVQMLGRVEGPALRDLYRRARALIYPQIEDFGITAVEAQACGCPVVALEAGGALDTVTDETGVFFQDPGVDGLCDGLRSLDDKRIDPVSCRRNAERFATEVFDREITRHVSEMFGKS
jgi:glycosyltransferase involved in cell wall biosynthesis